MAPITKFLAFSVFYKIIAQATILKKHMIDRHYLSNLAVNAFVDQIPSEYVCLKDFALELRRSIIEVQKRKEGQRLVRGGVVRREKCVDIEKKFEDLLFKTITDYAIINEETGNIYVIPDQVIKKFPDKRVIRLFDLNMEDTGRISQVNAYRCSALMTLNEGKQRQQISNILAKNFWPRVKPNFQPS